MDKETVKRILVYIEQSQENILAILEDESLPKIDRANLIGRYDGYTMIHSHLVSIFINA